METLRIDLVFLKSMNIGEKKRYAQGAGLFFHIDVFWENTLK